jgi:lysophospholipase L1-like esterase
MISPTANPKSSFILIGINDIGKDIPDSVIAYNYFKIIKQIHAKSPGTKIYVQSILPLNTLCTLNSRSITIRQSISRSVNAMLKANATAMDYTYITLTPLVR